jgi:hypothetical protein
MFKEMHLGRFISAQSSYQNTEKMDLILNLAQISPVLIILSHTTAYNFKEFPPQVTSSICPKPCPDFGFDRTWK